MRVLLLALLALPLVAAHLDAGEDRMVDGVLVDFGRSPAEIRAGEPTTLAVALNRDGVPLNGTAWVRISEGEEILLAADLALDGGTASLSFVFPERGEYDVTVRSGAMETTFAVDVAGRAQWGLLLALVFGALAGILVIRRKGRIIRSR